MNGVGQSICYVNDGSPGITRKRRGRYWQYFDAKGKRITDRDEIDRLNAIGMPPAYKHVWLCPEPNGHIQGVGYDDRGRKQYRYHPDFRARQDRSKFARMAEFGRALPKLRRRVDADLRRRTISCETVIAAVVRLIDSTGMRVGNEAYANANKSFGATTLRNRHVEIRGGKVRICFPGKSGVKQAVTVTDRRLARIAKTTQDLPGQHLFEYLNGDGEPRPVSSTDVNAYIRDATGEDYTAKDFRTWTASVIAFEEMLRRAEEELAIGIKGVIAPVAEALGNTPAISRKSYVHPALIEAAREAEAIGRDRLPRATKYLSAAERGLIDFLRRTRRRPRKAA